MDDRTREMLGNGSKLVTYYSWGGDTRAVAEYIAKRTGSELFEIVPAEYYPADYDACVSKVGRDGKSFEPELVGGIPDISSYDVVFVGSPCWWGTIANPLLTFLHQADLEGKVVAPFMTHGTSGLHVQDVGRLCKDSTVLPGLGIFNEYQVSTRINTPGNMGDWRGQVDGWLHGLGL